MAVKTITLEEIATIINTPSAKLSERLKEAGCPISDIKDALTAEQKKILMTPAKSENISTMRLKKPMTTPTPQNENSIAITVIKKKKEIKTHTTSIEKKKKTEPKQKTEPKPPPPNQEKIIEKEEPPKKEIQPTPTPASSSPIIRVPEVQKISDFAEKLNLSPTDLLKELLNMGMPSSITQSIDFETAEIIADELGFSLELEQIETQIDEDSSLENLQPKPPIVTIMGHVDHGKTTLLDTIRKSKITQSEAGGITQHIGAYQVTTKKGTITFLDTPGHAAFTAMRARGSQVTDIVILIVSADDGVKPQTIEAIQHAKAANASIIVGISKIDKPGADLEKVKQELVANDVVAEEWGGEVMVQPFSSKTGKGIDELLDAILLQSEMLELKANTSGKAKGIVIESKTERGKGPVATLLIQSGKLHHADIIVVGQEHGRIRKMTNSQGINVREAAPAVPVEIIGLSGVPSAGDEFIVMTSERKARELALSRQSTYREKRLAQQQNNQLDDLFNQAHNEKIEFSCILKTDTDGSLGAISDALLDLSTEEVGIKIVGKGIGGITESDVQLAHASNATIIAFNVRADKSSREIIQSHQIDVHYFSIIYNLIDTVKRATLGLSKPVFKETILGYAEVRQVFRSTKVGTISGCMVTSGTLKRHSKVRVLRDNVVIFEGEIDSLRRFKEDVEEVRKGMECGIGIKNYQDIREKDQFETFLIEEVKRPE